MNNIQCYLGRKLIFIREIAAFALQWLRCLHFGLTSRRTFQKCSVACFDKLPLIMIDKRRRDDTRLFVKCGPEISIHGSSSRWYVT